jgi:hypothetical protein
MQFGCHDPKFVTKPVMGVTYKNEPMATIRKLHQKRPRRIKMTEGGGSGNGRMTLIPKLIFYSKVTPKD